MHAFAHACLCVSMRMAAGYEGVLVCTCTHIRIRLHALTYILSPQLDVHVHGTLLESCVSSSQLLLQGQNWGRLLYTG